MTAGGPGGRPRAESRCGRRAALGGAAVRIRARVVESSPVRAADSSRLPTTPAVDPRPRVAGAGGGRPPPRSATSSASRPGGCSRRCEVLDEYRGAGWPPGHRERRVPAQLPGARPHPARRRKWTPRSARVARRALRSSSMASKLRRPDARRARRAGAAAPASRRRAGGLAPPDAARRRPSCRTPAARGGVLAGPELLQARQRVHRAGGREPGAPRSGIEAARERLQALSARLAFLEQRREGAA